MNDCLNSLLKSDPAIKIIAKAMAMSYINHKRKFMLSVHCPPLDFIKFLVFASNVAP
jgi:hypothetical protein